MSSTNFLLTLIASMIAGVLYPLISTLFSIDTKLTKILAELQKK